MASETRATAGPMTQHKTFLSRSPAMQARLDAGRRGKSLNMAKHRIRDGRGRPWPPKQGRLQVRRRNANPFRSNLRNFGRGKRAISTQYNIFF